MKNYRLHYKGNDVSDKESIVVLIKAESEEEAIKRGYLEIWFDFLEELDS